MQKNAVQLRLRRKATQLNGDVGIEQLAARL